MRKFGWLVLICLDSLTTLRILNFLPFLFMVRVDLPACKRWELYSGSTRGRLSVFLLFFILTLFLRAVFCCTVELPSFRSKSQLTIPKNRHWCYKALFFLKVNADFKVHWALVLDPYGGKQTLPTK